VRLLPAGQLAAIEAVTVPAAAIALLAGDELVVQLPLRFAAPRGSVAVAQVAATEAPASVDAAGLTPDRFVVHAESGAPLWEGTVGDLDSDADLKLQHGLVRPGEIVEITAFSYTQPEQAR
jgi:hypothetical protein